MQGSWQWGNSGVDIDGDHLLWWDGLGSVSYASGAASEQSFADFMASGPGVEGVPADILTEIRARLRQHPDGGERGTQQ